jgi:hypothetical protein
MLVYVLALSQLTNETRLGNAMIIFISILLFFRQGIEPGQSKMQCSASEVIADRSSNNLDGMEAEAARATRGPTFATAALFVRRGPRQGGAELLGISNGGPGTRLRVQPIETVWGAPHGAPAIS